MHANVVSDCVCVVLWRMPRNKLTELFLYSLQLRSLIGDAACTFYIAEEKDADFMVLLLEYGLYMHLYFHCHYYFVSAPPLPQCSTVFSCKAAGVYTGCSPERAPLLAGL